MPVDPAYRIVERQNRRFCDLGVLVAQEPFFGHRASLDDTAETFFAACQNDGGKWKELK